MRPTPLRAAVLLAGFALVRAAPLAGQDVDLEALRGAVAATPADPRPRCELAFGLARAGRYGEAVEAATMAIDALRPRADRASKRLLAACLYNRGRGHEGAGARALAIADYADSVDLRPNESVRARLAALLPDAPDAAPLAALAGGVAHFAFDPAAVLATARTRDRTRWLFVPSGRTEEPTVVAVARICGAPRAAEIARAHFDNHGALRVRSAAARHLGDVDAAVVEVSGSGDATCHEMEGAMEFTHDAIAVVFADSCRLRVVTFTTHADVCDDDRPEGLTVRFDRAGTVTTGARAGHEPSGSLGTFRLRDAAR